MNLWKGRSVPASALLVVAYFYYFVADTLKVHFAPDDMMNLATYWRLTPWQILQGMIMPWRGAYRPVAALYYLPLNHYFGLRPAPFHFVFLLLVLIGIGLTYWLAVLLGVSRLAGMLTSLIVCFHCGVANLYYNTAFIYDVLCGLFYLASLVYYVRIRQSGRALRGREIGSFLVLMLLALDAKEMAVTIPVVLVAYELIYRQCSWRPILLGGLLDLLYCYGKTHGRNALMSQPAYAPVFSIARWKDFQLRSFGELFLAQDQFRMWSVVLLWFAVFYIALRMNRPVLWFCALWVVVTPLPIEFLIGRGGACLYVPLFGWAVFAAICFQGLAGALARMLADDPVLRHVGAHAISGVLIVAGVFGWATENRRLKDEMVRPSMNALGGLTWDVIEQLNAMRPVVRPHSRIAFLDDPFEDWDMAFIADLWFRDRSLEIKLNRKTPLTAEELARADYLFTFLDGRLVQVR